MESGQSKLPFRHRNIKRTRALVHCSPSPVTRQQLAVETDLPPVHPENQDSLGHHQDLCCDSRVAPRGRGVPAAHTCIMHHQSDQGAKTHSQQHACIQQKKLHANCLRSQLEEKCHLSFGKDLLPQKGRTLERGIHSLQPAAISGWRPTRTLLISWSEE